MGAATLQPVHNSNNLMYIVGVFFLKPIPTIHNMFSFVHCPKVSPPCFHCLFSLVPKPILNRRSTTDEQQPQHGNLFDSTRIAENAPVTLRQLHSEPTSAASRLTLSTASMQMRQTKEMKKALIFVMRDLNNRTLI